MSTSRILVIGGSGNFGARICRTLSADGFEVLAAGRAPGRAVQIDITASGFEERLRAIAPALVIHCAGPFQGQDYRVARAALSAGANYLDLADGRAFVTGFHEGVDDAARAARRLALSGASTLPALSSAVVESLARSFASIQEVRITIAPGQLAPRGAATIAGVLSYAGKPFQRLHQGAWTTAWGWQHLEPVEIKGVGRRWGAFCDVPDLGLLPTRYPELRTVRFDAALESRAQHVGLWVAAALRRIGIPIPLERCAGGLDRLAAVEDRWAGDRGGMRVAVTGTRADGWRARREWHLSVKATDGPEIPCLAAVLLARKLVRRSLGGAGAYPCQGFLKLTEFQPEFERWNITTEVVEERL